LEQQEQRIRVAFPKRTEIGQGRQPVSERRKDQPFTAMIKNVRANGKIENSEGFDGGKYEKTNRGWCSRVWVLGT
jgi:hypothetical protein